MAYATIEAFNLGVDRRRPPYATPPGSLWSGINCHLSRGGDVESRKAFVAAYNLPSGTVGLCRGPSTLYVFGAAAPPPGIPSGITYQQLSHPAPTGRSIASVLDSDLFNGLPYVIAQYDNGDIYHFYNGTRVSFWDGETTRGRALRTHKNKLYSAGGSLLRFSVIGDPTTYTDNVGGGIVGSGLINMSNQYSGSELLVGLSSFQDRLAIFSRRVVQIWNMTSDPATNQQVQIISETGAFSTKSIRAIGDIDTFYLSDAGIRSLRSREYLNVAGIDDVGTQIDKLVLAEMAALSFPANCPAVVDPIEGRFWLAIGAKIFVYTNYPKAQVAGWTWYEPGFSVSDFAVRDNRVYARAGDTVYIYGGADNTAYDNCAVTVQLPYLALGKEGTAKQFQSVDIAAEGEWSVSLLTNPKAPAEKMIFGDIDGFSFSGPNTGGVGHFHHVAPILVSTASGERSVSKITLYYDEGENG